MWGGALAPPLRAGLKARPHTNETGPVATAAGPVFLCAAANDNRWCPTLIRPVHVPIQS